MASPPPWPRRLARFVARRWRRSTRALHRDIGYLAVGLTIVYALSGIAINHIDDWDSNFESFEQTHQLQLPLPTDEELAIQHVLTQLAIDEEPIDAYLATDDLLEIELEGRVLHVELASGEVFEEEQKERFFFRVANWLHYNRGKAAWTYVADGYAVLLLFLALSGTIMLRGRKGFIGRGAVLLALGAAVPILYAHFAGGPGG